jgi:hypothetical protein
MGLAILLLSGSSMASPIPIHMFEIFFDAWPLTVLPLAAVCVAKA